MTIKSATVVNPGRKVPRRLLTGRKSFGAASWSWPSGWAGVEWGLEGRAGPGREAWEQAVAEAGAYESGLWAMLYSLEEAGGSAGEAGRAYTDRVLSLAQALGYRELDGLPGRVRRIPPGPLCWAVAVVTMTAAERRFVWERLKRLKGAG